MVESNRTVKIKQLNGPEFDLSVNSEVRKSIYTQYFLLYRFKELYFAKHAEIFDVLRRYLEDMLFQEF